MQIVKVRYISEANGESPVYSAREYTYFSEDTLKVGDIILVPVRDTTGKAKVSAINIPETEVEAFRNKVKIIATGSIIGSLSEAAKAAGAEVTEAKVTYQPFNQLEATIVVQGESSKLIQQLTDAFPNNEIRDETHLGWASEALVNISTHLKMWNTKRTELVSPANNYVKSINDLFRKYTAPVEKEEQRLRQMMSAFRAKINAERQKLYQENLEKAKTAFPGGSPIPEVVAPIPQDTARKVEAEHGTVGFTTVWKFQVTDPNLVPKEYWILDEAKIGKVVKAGLRDIPGIRVYSEESPTVREK